MLTPLFGLLAALLVSGLLSATRLLSPAGSILPGALVFVGVVLLLLRRTSQRIEPLVKEAEKHIAGGRAELALQTLDRGLHWGRWHPLIPAQLRSMIGTLQFDLGRLEEAEENLARAIRWPWITKALLGVVYFKRREEPKMIKAFETAVKVGKKEPLAWTLYAYCMLARGKKDETVKILERALKENPGDGRLEANLELAKTGKKLKTAPYGDKWTRFRLDGEGPPLPKAARGFAVRPGFRQRARRR
jgi:tetratricopeptide (TPR) repeat protein